LGLAAPAVATAQPREVLTYTTDEGVVSFTDGQKQIPKKYRDDVEILTVDGLDDYIKGTRSDDDAQAHAVQARLSYLRSLR
jgi:hypothetical protein